MKEFFSLSIFLQSKTYCYEKKKKDDQFIMINANQKPQKFNFETKFLSLLSLAEGNSISGSIIYTLNEKPKKDKEV